MVKLQTQQVRVIEGLAEIRGVEKENRHQGPKWMVTVRGMMGKRGTDAPGDLFTPTRELTGDYLIKGLDGPGVCLRVVGRGAAVRSRGERE